MRCVTRGPVIGSLAVNGAAIRERLVAGDPLVGTVVSLPDAGDRSTVRVLGADVRIYARALSVVFREEPHVRT